MTHGCLTTTKVIISGFLGIKSNGINPGKFSKCQPEKTSRVRYGSWFLFIGRVIDQGVMPGEISRFKKHPAHVVSFCRQGALQVRGLIHGLLDKALCRSEALYTGLGKIPVSTEPLCFSALAAIGVLDCEFCHGHHTILL